MPREDSASRAEAPAWSTPMLVVLLAGVLLGALDIAIVGPAMPAIRESFGLDARELSWILNMYILLGLVGAPLLATRSDRLGRRRVYLFSLVVFGLGSAAVALASSYPMLLIGRGIQAFGAGGLLPIAGAVIADTFPEERRGRALGLIGAVFGIAFVLGPLLGGLLLRFSWRYLFVVNLPLVVILVVAAARLLPRAQIGRETAFDWGGAATLAFGLASLAWAASRIDAAALPAGLADGAVIAPLLVGVASLAIFWRVEQRADEPIMHPSMLGSLQMRIVGVLAVATGFVEACMVFLPVLAVTAFGVAASTASFMLLPLVGALIVGSVVAGRLLDRLGAKPVIQAGMGLTVVGLVLFAVLPLEPASFYASGFCVGFGLASLLGAPLRYVALEEGGATRRGASQGLLTISLSGGRMFGASLIGGIAASGAGEAAGYRTALLVVAVACCVSLVASGWLRSGRQRRDAGSETGEPGPSS